eukprot:903750_1
MSHTTHRDLTKRFKQIRNRYKTTPLDQFDDMISLPTTFQIMSTPLYYKSPHNEYVIIMTSHGLKCADIHNNIWIPVSCRPFDSGSIIKYELLLDFQRTYERNNRGIGITIHKTNNILYLICCQEARYCYCNLQPLDLQSQQELIFEEPLHSGLRTYKLFGRTAEFMNSQCVYVDALHELHVFGRDIIRSYHFILDEMEVFGDGFMETEGINGNRALRIAKMIHIKYSNELMVFGANHPMQNGPFQQSTWSRSVPTNVVIWKYTLGTHSKWDRVETKVPFQLGNKPNSTFQLSIVDFQVIVVFEYIVVLCMAKKFWFWNLVQNKWYHCCKTLPRFYDYLMITDDNIVHCFANGTNENRHIRFRLCDIMPSELCKELKNSYGDLVDKYTDYHFQYKMPHDIKRITLCYFVPF